LQTLIGSFFCGSFDHLLDELPQPGDSEGIISMFESSLKGDFNPNVRQFSFELNKKIDFLN